MANEKRLIYANELMSEVHRYDEQQKTDVWLTSDIVALLAEQPTVDALEVVHGWWIELPSMEPDYKCSECGQSYAWWEPSEAHYCPNCGAKMDGGVKNA